MTSMAAARNPIIIAATGVMAAIAAAAFSIAFVRAEDPAYAWDWGAYYRLYEAFGDLLRTNVWQVAPALISSLREADYNASSIVPLLPIQAVWGSSRTVYVTAIVVLYVVPACLLASAIAVPRRLASGSIVPVLAIVASALAFWPLWASGLRGMPDVVGLIPLGFATILLQRSQFGTRASPRQGAILGACLWAPFLLRRWYAYSIVAIALVATGSCVATLLEAPLDERRHLAKASATAALLAVGVFTGLLVAFQLPLLQRILQTNYAEIYSAYQAPFDDQLRHLLARAGPIVAVAWALGLCRGLIERDASILFTSATSLTTLLLFSRTQEPSIQHVLPIAFWAFPAIVAGATWPAVLARGRRASWAFGALPAVMILSFATVFVPGLRARLSLLSDVLPTTTTFPLRLEHRGNYDTMVSDIRSHVRSGDHVAVFASAEKLSDSLLVALDESLQPSVTLASQVDMRDGLRLTPFEARYVIATTQPAVHLAPGTQSVIAKPDLAISSGLGYGAAYKPVGGPYALDDEIVATLYERAWPLTASETSEIIADIRQAYPQWRLQPDGRVH